jgi:hypothetical protein
VSQPIDPLMFEFLTWVSSRRRTYAEAMEAWQTTCPRHPVWEDAIVDGLIRIENRGPLPEPEVTLTSRGRTLLDKDRSRKSMPTDPPPRAF